MATNIQVQNSFFVYAGRLASTILAFTIGIIVARHFGPSEFSLYSLFITSLAIGVALLGEGLTVGIVLYRKDDEQRAKSVLSSFLVLKVLIGLPFALLGCLVAYGFAEAIYDNRAYDVPIGLALIGSFGASLLTLALAGFQAIKVFVPYSIL